MNYSTKAFTAAAALLVASNLSATPISIASTLDTFGADGEAVFGHTLVFNAETINAIDASFNGIITESGLASWTATAGTASLRSPADNLVAGIEFVGGQVNLASYFFQASNPDISLAMSSSPFGSDQNQLRNNFVADSDGNSAEGIIKIGSVPEPDSLPLVALGGLALFGAGRYRQKIVGYKIG